MNEEDNDNILILSAFGIIILFCIHISYAVSASLIILLNLIPWKKSNGIDMPI